MTPTDIPGCLAGHWTHPAGTTGVTVLRFPGGATAGLAVPGHAPGSREHGVLDPLHLAGKVHAVVLSGGSAFGLSAADGVMAVLAADGEGFDTGAGRVPIVPAAILFDLPSGPHRPDAAAGAAAARACSTAPLAEGRVGAAAGARVGKAHGNVEPGGIGCAGEAVAAGTVTAVAAVNAFGGIRDPDGGAWLAGGPTDAQADLGLTGDWRGNTTLVAVVTDAPLTRVQCTVVARMASAGLARTIDPAFTPFDGDTIFVVATGDGPAPDAVDVATLGAAAARVVATAVLRGVRG
ncbi:MAG: P1 family peptidase [Alphaproteobacteria bacterium]|nr:P1 family peptidase [Alphaproteobacteria bacterium]